MSDGGSKGSDPNKLGRTFFFGGGAAAVITTIIILFGPGNDELDVTFTDSTCKSCVRSRVMERRVSLALRVAAVTGAAFVVFGGLAFAARSDGDSPASEPALALLPTPTSTGEPPPTAPPPATPVRTATQEAALTAPPEATLAPTEPAPMSPVVAVRPQPTLPPAPTPSGPVTDLPKYSDVEVLALAAGAVLPSAKTFRECVELPPSHEKWPTPVHLYYEGSGRWLVETHVSEVQVAFDEATATFSPRNFAPTNPACR